MGADISESRMRFGLVIILVVGVISLIMILGMICFTAHRLRSLGNTIDKEIRRSSMSVFYSSLVVVCAQQILWSGIFTNGKDCKWIVKINIATLIIAKMCLYYLYTIRLEFTFRNTDWKITSKKLRFIRMISGFIFIIVAMFMIVDADSGNTLENKWGLYCNIQLSQSLVYCYGTSDGIITVYLLYLFISRLIKVLLRIYLY